MTRGTIPEIALRSTEELIAELLERRTLAGVLIYSPDEHRHVGQVHHNFQVRTTMTDQATILLLAKTLEILRHN